MDGVQLPYRPPKDERLSQPWSHPMVLNTGSLDCESSVLTTRPLPHNGLFRDIYNKLTLKIPQQYQ